jgi:4a-hydroxytetrahydrobiopterin dehydratase
VNGGPQQTASAPLAAAVNAGAQELAQKHCVPCKGGVPPLDAVAVSGYLSQLRGWAVIDGHHLTKVYGFKNFAEALSFADRIGALAEEEQHHPDLCVSWGKLRADVWTHKIDGLTESDFIFAAKIDALLQAAPAQQP